MKTKIIATLGPSSDTPEKMRDLINSGVSVFRLNFSHGNASKFETIVGNIRKVEAELKKPITIMQ
ncbi:MAG: pyruvate kinase, partial [Desulfovibrionaceae bacterium]|nr:pyruvate kinase [Desulfovibrionaceae bacterium]